MALSSSTPVSAVIMQLIAMAVGILVYYPFVKSYDNQLFKKEEQAELAEQN